MQDKNKKLEKNYILSALGLGNVPPVAAFAVALLNAV